MEVRMQMLEQQNLQYKVFYEQARNDMRGGNGGLEISNLHQQLSAVMMLKDALNMENLELQRHLQAANRERADRAAESKHTACVICMDNLANVVCLPCKHLSLCTFCNKQQS